MAVIIFMCFYYHHHSIDEIKISTPVENSDEAFISPLSMTVQGNENDKKESRDSDDEEDEWPSFSEGMNKFSTKTD